MNTEINEQLKLLALRRTIPFCYSCYHEAPSGTCKSCGSDDLMRLLPGNGVEYGTDWVVKAILQEELDPVDLDEEFEESVRQCYPETTQIGWMSFETVTIMKNEGPVSWSCAQSEWESQEVEDGRVVTFDNGSNYYRSDQIVSLFECE